MNKFIKIVLILFIVAMVDSCQNACNEYSEEKTTLIVSTEIVDCEEDNHHLKVIDANKKNMIGNYMLPVCIQENCKTNFYAMHLQDTISKYKIEGYISKKNHNSIDYGCVYARCFKIISYKKIP